MYPCCPGHCCQPNDAAQAYVQAWLKRVDTWIALPREAWPAHGLNDEGTPNYDQPVVLLLRALCGHPDAGTYWEQHCDDVVRKIGVLPIQTWPSCYYHPTWKLILSVYVDDFKLSGPDTYMEVSWIHLQQHLEMEEPVPAGLYVGGKLSCVTSNVDNDK